MHGYMGKMLFVNLTNSQIEVKELTEDLAVKFVGGYGIGAKVLYDMMKPGVGALSEESVIGFTTGPTTGTSAFFSGRFTVIHKSPVNQAINDANSGGYFGPELKKAGYDAVFVYGKASKPVYIWINDGNVEIRDASDLWGKNSLETEQAIRNELGDSKIRAAVIGQAGEKLSYISCVITDGHRAAGRGGAGAVMGWKNLKAVAARGTQKVSVADKEAITELNKELSQGMKEKPGLRMAQSFGTYGTGVGTAGQALMGDTPIKNWAGAGGVDFGKEMAAKIDVIANDSKYKVDKYGCANCPLRCGAKYEVKEGKWPLKETERPEYETFGAFGGLVLNADFEAVLKCNEICNRYGVDTISAGATIAWAMECYGNNVLSIEETGGIDLKWGDADAMVRACQELADQSTEFGKLLALGSEKAAKQIGKGFEYLMNVLGIELPMHDSRCGPGLCRTYQFDPTPSRHVKGGFGIMQLFMNDPKKYSAEGTGKKDLYAVIHTEIMNTLGLCQFHEYFIAKIPDYHKKLFKAITGLDLDRESAGIRIMNMRHIFNIREGFKTSDRVLPGRASGRPPQTVGPHKGVTIDNELMGKNFFEAIQWDWESGKPSRESLERLGGFEEVLSELY